MTMKVYFNLIIVFQIFLLSSSSFAQGPKLSYLFDPHTKLSWASCYVYLEGGSKRKIPFFPMINYKGSPCGTNKYTQDIKINAPIVFVGNGIVKEDVSNCYNNLDIRGKVVMFCYDFPDSIHAKLEKELSKEKRIDEAVSRGAAALILFSMNENYPLLKYFHKNLSDIPEIPIIGINKIAAEAIFASAGRDAENIFQKWESTGNFKSEDFISKITLRIDGKFNNIETENFNFVFREELIPQNEMKELIEVNEKSIKFILDLFKSEQLVWKKSFAAYFRDYDSKLFYTAHWGKGFSFDGGTFMVYDGKIPDYGLAAHENAHTLIRTNWDGSSSFMTEGIGKYVEAKATNENKNHLKIIDFLKSGELLPLEKLIAMNIGSDSNTFIAYPAAGSFMDYLINTYGLSKVKTAYRIESQKEKTEDDTWIMTFQNPLETLEKSWLIWLVEKFDQDKKLVEAYFDKR